MGGPATLTLLGASVRAAAYSALRAGLRPVFADLFADRDLRAIANGWRCPYSTYPDDLAKFLSESPNIPWAYTGGLENHPDLIARMERIRPLWGNGGDVLRRVRSPLHLVALLRTAGLPFLEAYLPGQPIPAVPVGTQWLRKPLRGAGGAGIAFFPGPVVECSPVAPQPVNRPLSFSVAQLINQEQVFDPRVEQLERMRGDLPVAEQPDYTPQSVYYQRYCEGSPHSAVFAGIGTQAHLLGITRQLIGLEWLHARPFCYCGSVGPVELGEETRGLLMRIGAVLMEGCGLRGLFGVDFILDGEVPYLVEVNPRYVASVEVLEHGAALQAFTWHRAAFVENSVLPEVATDPRRSIGKAVLFAESKIIFPTHGPWENHSFALHPPPSTLHPIDFADIPDAGEKIEAGWPILSIFAEGDSETDCIRLLQNRAAELREILNR